MGWIRCVCWVKLQRDFVARTFALISPVQPILHRVSCSNEMVPNIPKHYETHQNMSLGSDGVDRVDLLQKILTQLCGLNFCINYNSSPPCWTEYRKATEWSQMHPNTTEANKSLGSNGVDRGIRCEKFRHDFVAWSFPLIAPAQPILHQVSCSNEMVPNAPKHYETQQKLSLGSNGVDQVRSLRKHPMQLRGMNFCINWTSSAHFALSLLS